MSISKRLDGKPMKVRFCEWNRGGEFGVVSKKPEKNTNRYIVSNTHNCRETFATAWGRQARTGSGLISYDADSETRFKIAAFIKKLEDKLGLKERTVFHSISGNSNGLIIAPSKWWLRSAMRRSIFTIFLRAGKSYKGSFNAAIKSQSYFRETATALSRFLEGNTYYRGSSGGWVNVFSQAGKVKINKRLLPESAEKRIRIPIFGEKLDISFRSFNNAETGNYAPLIPIKKKSSKHKYKTEYWSYCREKMDGRKWTSIVFCHKKSQGKHVAAFIRRIERRLEFTKFSECGPTNRKGVMWIKVSRFWHSTQMRKSFFTAMLRASLMYNPNKSGSYTKALTESKYFKPTSLAVKLFLQGKTKWNGKTSPQRDSWTGRLRRYPKQFSGWVNEFSNRRKRYGDHKEEIEKMLKQV